MKVVNISDTSHSIEFIPRLYNVIGTTLLLTNEANKEEYTITHTISGSESIITLSFDYTFTEGDRFQIKLSNETEVIYRGRLIATDQTPQNYNATKDYYTYE